MVLSRMNLQYHIVEDRDGGSRSRLFEQTKGHKGSDAFIILSPSRVRGSCR